MRQVGSLAESNQWQGSWFLRCVQCQLARDEDDDQETVARCGEHAINLFAIKVQGWRCWFSCFIIRQRIDRFSKKRQPGFKNERIGFDRYRDVTR